ncbi:beta strand repeat-containing protein, partial [Lysobacter sp. CA199]|uniref:beta strand repeat-containing protein n=1 Tax=Lysobacter sp. CA199 TaxID=3455608 RepID=UPI003F8D55A3
MLLASVLALAGLPAMAQFANPLNNTATITPPTNVTNVDTACTANGGTFNSGTGACSATDSNTLAAVSNVGVSKSGPTSIGANGTVVYTIVVTNAGPSAANGTVLTDPAVANFTATTLTCGTPTGGAVCPAGPTVAQLQGSGVVIPTLPNGGSVTFTLTGTAGTGTTIANTATVAPPSGTTDPTPGNNTSTANTAVAVVTIAKSANPASGTTVTPGQTITYTLTATVSGATTTAPTVFTDTLGGGLTFSGATPAGCVVAAPNITCTLATGSTVGTHTFVYSATVSNTATIAVTNNVSGGNGCTTPGGCGTSHNVASLNIAKTAVSTTGPNASGVYSVLYTVTVANTGDGTGTYGPLVDTTQFASNLQAQGATWTTSGGAPAGGTAVGAGPYTLAAAGTSIAGNATHTYSVTVNYVYTNQTQATACGSAGTGLFNSVSLPAGQEAGGAGDNSACIQPPAPPLTELTVAKSHTLTEIGTPNNTVEAGETINYTVTVTNTGNVTITGVTVTDVFNNGSGSTL